MKSLAATVECAAMLRSWLALALALHLVFATSYAWCTPSFEGPDENSHYEYAWHLGNGRHLPLAAALATARNLPQTEGAVLAHHPPLYYALLGGVLLATGSDDTVFGPMLNPNFGQADQPSRHLKFCHGSGQGEGVLRQLRLLSVVLGGLTIALVHRLGRAACPLQPRIGDLAALLVACLPMWSFLHGVLNSDVLAATLSTATTLLLVHLARAERIALGAALGLGALLGLALLTKLTTLYLLPLAAAACLPPLLRARGAGALAPSLLRLGLGVLLVSALAGWTFVRNQSLYGDPLALVAHDAAFAPIPAEYRWQWLYGGFLPAVFSSLLGNFGWFSLAPHPGLLWTGAGVAALALLGLGRSLLARDSAFVPRPLWLLLSALVLVFAGTAHFNWKAPQPQGRLLFPAIGPAAVLLAAGLVRLSASWRRRRWLVALLPLTAGTVFGFWFSPAFAPALARAPAWHRALVGGIVGEVATPGIHWREPLPPPSSATAPTLRWSDPGAPPDARYSLYAYDDGGRVWLATHEWGQSALLLQHGEATLPAAAMSMLAKGVPMRLKLRRVPSTPDDDPVHLPTSPSLPFRRD